MEQKTIREFNDTSYTIAEAKAWLKELDDRTKSDKTGYNSIAELAAVVKVLTTATVDVDLTGQLKFENINGTYYNKIILADFGSIPFSVGEDAITTAIAYVLIESDGTTPIATPIVMESVFKSGLEYLPSTYILEKGTYEFMFLKTPTGVALSYRIYDRSIDLGDVVDDTPAQMEITDIF